MTARPMRPKSPLGVIRAGPPTLMPARRALQSAHNSHQHNFTWPAQINAQDLLRNEDKESTLERSVFFFSSEAG